LIFHVFLCRVVSYQGRVIKRANRVEFSVWWLAAECGVSPSTRADECVTPILFEVCKFESVLFFEHPLRLNCDVLTIDKLHPPLRGVV